MWELLSGDTAVFTELSRGAKESEGKALSGDGVNWRAGDYKDQKCGNETQ